MSAVAALVIEQEMDDWVKLGGRNLGIIGDENHTYGFHPPANRVPASDYSRYRDPNGSDGPYVDWNYCCAGDFGHDNKPHLRAKHADVLNRLMVGQFPMVCEFIGQPWPDRPVLYWARWNGIGVLQEYTGSGHDRWSHISWYRSKANQRPYLWAPSGISPYLRRRWPSNISTNEYFGLISGPNQSHGGYYAHERDDIKAIQQRLIWLGYVPNVTNVNAKWADGIYEAPTRDAVSRWQRHKYATLTSRYGEVWLDDWKRLFTY